MTHYTIKETRQIGTRLWHGIEWAIMSRPAYHKVSNAIRDVIPESSYSSELRLQFVPTDRMKEFEKAVESILGPDLETLEEAFAEENG